MQMPNRNRTKSVGSATFTYRNKSLDLPVYAGTEGPEAVDVRKLYSEGGMFTYDPGFTSTASCESDITFIDGDEGILLYRGYPIDELARQSHFLEVCYLTPHQGVHRQDGRKHPLEALCPLPARRG